MPVLTSFRIIYRALTRFGDNKGSQMGAALAYYSLFSIAPLLFIAIFIAGIVLGEEDARNSALGALRQNMGEEPVKAVEMFLANMQKPTEGIRQTLVAVVVLLLGALNVFFQMRTSFSSIWNLPMPRGNSFLGLLLSYFLAILMVIIVGILLLASVLTSTFLALAVDMLIEKFPEINLNWQLAEFGISFLYTTLLFALIYYIMSGRQLSLGYVLYGSIITSLLFTAGKTLLGLYFAYFNIGSTYGAAGSIVIFLIWIYYSAQIIIFGAELIQARRTRAEWMGR